MNSTQDQDRQETHHPGKWLLGIAYVLVILIWSTTPLAIKWSGIGVSFLFGVSARMFIGMLVAVVLSLLLYRHISFSKSSCKGYFAVAVMIFCGMIPVYWAAQYISSGLISVIFGLTPIVTGFIAWYFINEQSFNAYKVLGALFGVLGLALIFFEDTVAQDQYFWGVLAVLLAVLSHSASTVWIKSMKISLPPLMLVAGGLLFSMPGFITVYLIFSPPLPDVIPAQAIWSIVYLGVVGSVIGFLSYYFLLRYLPAASVALITLITPVAALWIGHAFNDESIFASIYYGTACVLTGLAFHQWGYVLSEKVWKKRNVYSGSL